MTRSMRALAYADPSALGSGAGGRLLGLETSGGPTPAGPRARPTSFSGGVASPRTAARGLPTVADVAAARYVGPRPGPLLDPVVTGDSDRLRFESVSGCRGVYARLDVSREGLEGAETPAAAGGTR